MKRQIYILDNKIRNEKNKNIVILKPCEKYYTNLKACLDSNNNNIHECDLQQLSLKMCLSKNYPIQR